VYFAECVQLLEYVCMLVTFRAGHLLENLNEFTSLCISHYDSYPWPTLYYFVTACISRMFQGLDKIDPFPSHTWIETAKQVLSYYFTFAGLICFYTFLLVYAKCLSW